MLLVVAVVLTMVQLAALVQEQLVATAAMVEAAPAVVQAALPITTVVQLPPVLAEAVAVQVLLAIRLAAQAALARRTPYGLLRLAEQPGRVAVVAAAATTQWVFCPRSLLVVQVVGMVVVVAVVLVQAAVVQVD